ncbi:hypothetical protein [Nocardia fluminea]|uniref:Uncharacterized protein n=1 Tax=Nocardia fluminea TaxID=134984 RepID=A0A2N3VA72_9NOCA|nr:hypothetical protein [Nocardia fluminea]PKV78518.1 hypothetical protein ATK86_2891 [Nocardia fluminea]
MEQVRPERPSRALIAGWLGVLVGAAGIFVGTATSVLRALGREIDLDYVGAGIVGALGVVYLVGAVLLLRRRMLGRRLLLTMAAVMAAATLLVIVLNGASHGWRFGPLDFWLVVNVVILALSLSEPTRRWTTTR